MLSTRPHSTSTTPRSVAVAALAVFILLAGSALAAPPAAAQVGPQITVTPSTGLVDRQIVTIDGTGFTPGQGIVAVMCDAAATSTSGCDLDTLAIGTLADATGAFSIPYQVRRDLIVESGGVRTWLDCEVQACMVAAGSPDNFALAPVTLAPTTPTRPAPGMVVTEFVEQDNGAFARFLGEGLPVSRVVRLQICLATGPGCNAPVDSFPVTTSPSGTLDLAAAFGRGAFDGSTFHDCGLPPGCRAQVELSGLVLASTSVLPFTPTELTISIQPFATFGPGSGDAVAQATITCNRATPVAVVGSITQGGLAGSHSFASGASPEQWCLPTAPLLAFLPAATLTGTGAFGPGPATVTVEAHAGFGPGTAPATASAPVDMLDQVALAAAIGDALLDPANTALRDAIAHAIRTRYWQDPAFAALWRSLVGG